MVVIYLVGRGEWVVVVVVARVVAEGKAGRERREWMDGREEEARRRRGGGGMAFFSLRFVSVRAFEPRSFDSPPFRAMYARLRAGLPVCFCYVAATAG